RSFSSAEDAATYVQKLVRGSVLSIKLGQELDTAEYGDQGQELNERPAIDKQPGLSDQQDEQLTTTTGTRILDVATWLLDALSAAGYQIVKPDQLKSMPIFTNGRELTVDEVNLYNPDLYANHVTPPLGTAESAAKTPGAGDVFVGDSQTVILQSYVEWKRSVDPAYWEGVQFLCTDSLSVSGALGRVTPDSTVFPQYMGAPASLENALSLMGAKRVFWMLGAADMRGSSAEQFIANLKILLYSIQQKNPGVELVIQSIPPGISGRSGTPSNDRIFRFDLALAAFCAQYDLAFCDVASALRDEKGDLPTGLCANASTYGTALNDRGCDTWVQYLLTHLP
ncbi:MAG: GDSL-type esterase/lipase family protein, partial [Eubacteriales bacterium]|nr:GDSL-type esterase/lipase family protein [Eubacteriales bacterium]